MSLSTLRTQGLDFLRKLSASASDALRADSQWALLKEVLTRYHTALRPLFGVMVRLIIQLLDGPASPMLKFSLRLWLGAFLLRSGVTTLFLLYKLVRRTMTSVLSVGTGSTRSVARRDAWRLTVPVRETGLMPLHAVQFATYVVEQVAAVLIASSLLVNAVLTHEHGGVALAQRVIVSILTLRPIRLVISNPVEFFIVFPLIYGWLKYRSLSQVVKAKVVVNQTVNNYLGGKIEKKEKSFDALLVAHLAIQTTGLPWCAQMFLVYRNSVIENGLWPTYDTLRHQVRNWWRAEPWWRQILRAVFLVSTTPMAVCATLLAGTSRPAFAPTRFTAGEVLMPEVAPRPVLPVVEVGPASEPVELPRPGLGFAAPPRPRNALVEIYRLPHAIGLEMFARGESLLLGGERLPVLCVVDDPRLLVKIPTKPVTNNTFAWDILTMMGDHPVAARLRELTKVPANPFRNAVEIQKFVSANLDVELDQVGRFSDMTAREFILEGLKVVYCLNSTDWREVGDVSRNANIDDYLNRETKKHHPGWTTRAFGGQTKAAAWPYSVDRAARLWFALLQGDREALKTHVWLFLGVVKKQAERKEFDEEYRSRGAVIPEQELQIVWTHLMRPLQALFESKAQSWAGKFELFHRGLEVVWRKFAVLRNVQFVNEDMRDHGASLEAPVSSLIAQFYGRCVRSSGDDTVHMFEALFNEMIFAVVGLPAPDGTVQLVKTSRGMKDGVFGTSTIGGTYKVIGELWKVWRLWNANPDARNVWKNPIEVVKLMIEEVHGDNSLAAYPMQIATHLSGATPETARLVLQLGLCVKTEETLASTRLEDMTCMSWRMANIGTIAAPQIIGWKPTAELLKSFFLPERIADFDHIGDATRDYLGQILTCLYILGYWNGEVRMFCVHAWQLLWADTDEEKMLSMTSIRDFVFKTGMSADDLEPVSVRSPHPYDPQKILKLWLGDRAPPRLMHETAPGAPTLTDGGRMMVTVARMRESHGLPFALTQRDEAVVDYDDEAAGAFGSASHGTRNPVGIPGGARHNGYAQLRYLAALVLTGAGIVHLYIRAIQRMLSFLRAPRVVDPVTGETFTPPNERRKYIWAQLRFIAMALPLGAFAGFCLVRIAQLDAAARSTELCPSPASGVDVAVWVYDRLRPRTFRERLFDDCVSYTIAAGQHVARLVGQQAAAQLRSVYWASLAAAPALTTALTHHAPSMVLRVLNVDI